MMGVATSKFKCGCYFSRDMDSEKIIYISFCQKHIRDLMNLTSDKLVDKMIELQNIDRKNNVE